MTRRSFLKYGSGAAAVTASRLCAQTPTPPNIVLVLCDDLGYGDLGCYGSRIKTPNIDKLASDGVRATSFCSASPVCSPSRAALLTGRYGVRVGVPYVLGPDHPGGLSLSEMTLPQSLKSVGYRTMCVGKWHLGTSPAYTPNARGFDEYFGLPYSNDNAPSVLMRNSEVVEAPVDQETLTRRYTEHAREFIRNNSAKPFFLYMPHTFPHIPLAVSRDFQGKSAAGVYGDAVSEVDWSVGQIIDELAKQDLTRNTLVLFTSDNGPWFQGSPGRLRGRKGDTFEGGMRVPFIASWQDRIPKGKTLDSFASMLDLFPTVTSLSGAPVPEAPLDGVSIWPMLSGESESVDRPPFLYFDGFQLQCARVGNWKLHMSRFNGPAFAPRPEGGRINLPLVRPELYNMQEDPEESYCVTDDHGSVAADIRARVEGMLPASPPSERSAWADTLRRPCNPVNAGEWPSLASGV